MKRTSGEDLKACAIECQWTAIYSFGTLRGGLESGVLLDIRIFERNLQILEIVKTTRNSKSFKKPKNVDILTKCK